MSRAARLCAAGLKRMATAGFPLDGAVWSSYRFGERRKLRSVYQVVPFRDCIRTQLIVSGPTSLRKPVAAPLS